MPLKQVGSVSAPEPRLLVVQPWDKCAASRRSRRAIQLADLGLNPDRRRHGGADADPDAHRGAPARTW